MARYIPTDDMGRIVASEYLSSKIRAELGQDGLDIYVGDMDDSGGCRVTLKAQQAEFDFRTMLDTPEIHGVAWIEDVASARVDYDFGDSMQPYAFITEHAR